MTFFTGNRLRSLAGVSKSPLRAHPFIVTW
jgi:hypothetical protein